MTVDLTCPETPIEVLLGSDDVGAENGLPFAITDSAGAAANITGATFWFRVFRSQYDADAAALLTATNAASATGVVITNAAGGLGRVDITTEAKVAALGIGSYYYRLHMRESNGTDTLIRRGAYVVAG